MYYVIKVNDNGIHSMISPFEYSPEGFAFAEKLAKEKSLETSDTYFIAEAVFKYTNVPTVKVEKINDKKDGNN